MNESLCEKHGCPIVQVQDLPPVCLLEWLAERVGGRRIQDALPPGDDSALVLDGGFALPYNLAYDALGDSHPVEVDLSFAGWYVSNVLYFRGDKSEVMLAKIRPPEARHDDAGEFPAVVLRLPVERLLYLLFDEQIRKVEP